MEFDLIDVSKRHIIVAAHRGVSGGNIPCNTIAAYEIALLQGADMIEVDVDVSLDGALVIFHPNMEEAHLRINKRIPTMTYEYIKSLRYVNYDRTPTQFGIATFDEVLECFKGRCYINVDKFWGHPVEIYNAIKRHGMLEQTVVKCSPSEKVFNILEEVAPDIPYLPIVKDNYELHEELMKRNINYLGAEMLFTSESSRNISREIMDKMHRDGKLIWANSIIYNYKDQLSAFHSDDTALTKDMEKGWGWLADRGFDIIQTDWPSMLIEYLKNTNRYYKKQN